MTKAQLTEATFYEAGQAVAYICAERLAVDSSHRYGGSTVFYFDDYTTVAFHPTKGDAAVLRLEVG